MAQATFNPSSYDSMYSMNNVWATCRAATTGTLRGADPRYSQSGFNSPNYFIERGFFVFDTSSLPENILISSATISITGGNDKVSGGVRHYALYNTTCGDTVVADDFNNQGSTILSDQIAQASLPTTTPAAVFTLNADGLTNISTTGLSKFCLLEIDKDVDNVAPTEITRWGLAAPITLTVNYSITFVPKVIII